MSETNKKFKQLSALVSMVSIDDTFGSDNGGEKTIAVLWPNKKQRGFSFSKFLESLDLLTKLSSSELLAIWKNERVIRNLSSQSIQKCESLLKYFEDKCTKVFAYELKTFQEDFEDQNDLAPDGFPGQDRIQMIIGKTKDNNWVGIIPYLVNTSPPKLCLLPREKFQVSNSARTLIGELETINQDLLSTTDLMKNFDGNPNFPVSAHPMVEIYTVHWQPDLVRGIAIESAPNKATLIERLLERSSIMSSNYFENFPLSLDRDGEIEDFEKYPNRSRGYTQEYATLKLQMLYQSRHLEDFLKNELEQTREYSLGYETVMRKYIFGQLSNRDWLGIFTCGTYS